MGVHLNPASKNPGEKQFSQLLLPSSELEKPLVALGLLLMALSLLLFLVQRALQKAGKRKKNFSEVMGVGREGIEAAFVHLNRE